MGSSWRSSGRFGLVSLAVMGLQDLVRWLLPKDDHFYGFLERQAVAAHDGAVALAVFKNASSSAEVVAKSVHGARVGAVRRSADRGDEHADRQARLVLKDALPNLRKHTYSQLIDASRVLARKGGSSWHSP